MHKSSICLFALIPYGILVYSITLSFSFIANPLKTATIESKKLKIFFIILFILLFLYYTINFELCIILLYRYYNCFLYPLQLKLYKIR